MIEHIIPANVPPTPLEKYLRRAWPLMPGRVLRDALKKRDVRVNGATVGARRREGRRRACAVRRRDSWFDAGPDILWTDDKLIVAVKPQGLPVDVDRDGVGADTLLTRLQGRWPGARLCHRLDAQTGGIVLAAADEAVWQQAFEAFRDHRGVTKRYAALAFGRFDQKRGHAERLAQSRTPGADGARAAPRRPRREAHRDPLSRGRGGRPGAVPRRAGAVTGRTHQLRAHMADFGHPLLGDDKYGDRAANRRFPGAPLPVARAADGARGQPAGRLPGQALRSAGAGVDLRQ